MEVSIVMGVPQKWLVLKKKTLLRCMIGGDRYFRKPPDHWLFPWFQIQLSIRPAYSGESWLTLIDICRVGLELLVSHWDIICWGRSSFQFLPRNSQGKSLRIRDGCGQCEFIPVLLEDVQEIFWTPEGQVFDPLSNLGQLLVGLHDSSMFWVLMGIYGPRSFFRWSTKCIELWKWGKPGATSPLLFSTVSVPLSMNW